MIYDLLIKNGNIVTGNEITKGNIYVLNGKIAAITMPDVEAKAKEVLDAQGKYVYSGFIDTHVHSRDGGQTQKEDFFHSTMSAAFGGITTILEMPNAVPAVVDRESFIQQKENLESKAYVDFGMWGLCVGSENNDKLEELAKQGVVGFKFFWGYSISKKDYSLIYSPSSMGADILPPFGDGEIFEIFKKVEKTGKLIAIHAENAGMIKSFTEKINVQDYKNEYEALLATRPAVTEETTVKTAISFSNATDAHLHILHVSSKEAVELIREAKRKGYHVTGETCPQYLTLTNEDYDRVGKMMKGYPPVRYKEDRAALWSGLKDGTLAFVCSDHAPHRKEDKQGSIFDIPAGMCAIETMVPLLADEVNKGRITKRELAVFLSENPAKQYGLYPEKGSLEIGTDADITIIDFQKEKTIHADELHSVSKVTAYDGFQVSAMPVCTILRGNILIRDGVMAGDRRLGKFIHPFPFIDSAASGRN